MVELNRSGSYSQFVYSPTGTKLAVMSGQSLVVASVPLAAGAIAEYHPGGTFYYRHSDWLGSSRFISTTTRTVYSDMAYAPFGEVYAQSGTSDVSFTDKHQDTAAGLYDFPAREYSIQGRWPSPDPAGLASVNPAYPQSWNRYAYVLNNPLALTDPSGFGACPAQYTTYCNMGNHSYGVGYQWNGWDMTDLLQLAFTPTDYTRNPDWWTTGCIEYFDCGNIPMLIPVYGNLDALSVVLGAYPTSPYHDAIDNAYQALGDSSCRALFGDDLDPQTLLITMAASGQIQGADLGNDSEAAVTQPLEGPIQRLNDSGQVYLQAHIFPGANITVNSGSGAPFAAGFPTTGIFAGYDQATLQSGTIMHELGHAANYAFGNGSSAIFLDGSETTASRMVSYGNTIRVMENCY